MRPETTKRCKVKHELQFLTRGAFSEILVDYASGLCCKFVSNNAERPHVPSRELALLKSLQKKSHGNVIEMKSHDSDVDGQGINLWFPYYDQTLLEYICSGPSEHLPLLIRDIASGLAHLHGLGILHRDICPSNIMIDGAAAKPRAILIDLGIAWSSWAPFNEPSNELLCSIGTGSFRAPELLFGCSDYDECVDLWSFGCTIFQLVHPEHIAAFDAGDDNSELMLLSSIFRQLGTPTVQSWHDAPRLRSFSNLQFKEYDPIPWSELLPTQEVMLREIVQNLLVYNTKDRMTATNIEQLLSDKVHF